MNGRLDKPADILFPAFVHVIDLAEAHVNAIERPQTAGKRYFVAAGTFQCPDVCHIIREDFPEPADQVPDPLKTLRIRNYGVDGGSAIAKLEIDYKGIRQAIRDTVLSLKDIS